MSKQWKQDIHDRLKDFPKKAPEGLLDDIKSEMARRGLNTVSSVDANRQRTVPSIMLRVASVAAIIAILFSLSHWFQQEEIPASLPEAGITMPPTEDENTPTPQEEAMESLPVVPTSNRLVAKTVVKTDTLTEVTTDCVQEETTIEEEADTLTRQTPPQPKKVEPASNRKQWTYPTAPRKKRPSLDVGIYYSGLVAQGDLNLFGETYNSDIGSNQSSPGENNDSNPGGANGSEQSPPGENNDSTTTANRGVSRFASRAASRSFNRRKSAEKAKHHIPIRMGLSLRYYLNESWNIQTGLTYSYLASDLSYNGFDVSYETKQKLHYIGIPLQLGLRIWKNNQFRSYISAGGQMEKLVSGKATTHYTMDDGHSGTLIEDISDNRLLFSALASIGIEYALGKDFSLYAEPGIHYYFKNGNGLKTHYNEQPLNLNITIGFRFHWKK